MRGEAVAEAVVIPSSQFRWPNGQVPFQIDPAMPDQQRVTDANSRMSIQSDIMTKHISALESVDPYEASSRLSALMTQVETAYAMTARIEKLTLLNYLTP